MDLYHSIPQYPDEISGTTTLIRLLDGLGFRLRWSTENLRETDYNFKPRDDCMSIEELVRHIWGLVNWVCQSMHTKRFPKQKDINATRISILELIITLRETLETMDTDELAKITIDNRPFWYIINGPIADAFTHVGQINSFRRLAGNPTPNANVFVGTPPKD